MIMEKITNEELHNSYCSTNTTQITKSRRARWAGDVVRMGDMKGVYRVFVGKREGRVLLGKHRHR